MQIGLGVQSWSNHQRDTKTQWPIETTPGSEVGISRVAIQLSGGNECKHKISIWYLGRGKEIQLQSTSTYQALGAGVGTRISQLLEAVT